MGNNSSGHCDCSSSSNNATSVNSLNRSAERHFKAGLPPLTYNVTPPNVALPSSHSVGLLSPTDSGTPTTKLMGNLPQWNSSQETVEHHKLVCLPSPVRYAPPMKEDPNVSSMEANKLKSSVNASKTATFRGLQAARQLQLIKQSPPPLPKISSNDSMGGSASDTGGIDVLTQEKQGHRLSQQHVAIADCSVTIDSTCHGGASIRTCDDREIFDSPCSYGGNRPFPQYSSVTTPPEAPLAKHLTGQTSKPISDVTPASDNKEMEADLDYEDGTLSKEDRIELFRQLKSVSALLTRFREHQEQNDAGATYSPHSLSNGQKKGPAFYCTQLTDEEEKLIEGFLFEASEVKARMQPKYGLDTVQGSWGLLLKSPRLNEFKRDLYNALIRERLLIPNQISQQLLEDRGHAFFRIVNTTVNRYGKPREMVDFLVQTGAEHQRFGIGENECLVLRNAVIRLLPNYLPAEVVEASAKDWDLFWGLTINLMTQGGKTPEGQMNRKLYEEDYAKQIQTIIRDIKANQDKLPLEKHFVNVMFDKSREICPHLEKFRTLFNNRRSCDRFYASLVTIADNITHPEKKAGILEELGGRHVAYGITRHTLVVFEEPFIAALRELLAEHPWDITLQHNLELFYQTMVDGISAGMNNGKDTTANRWAPDGSEPFCLLFTDVESSTNLWQRYPTIMREAIDKHHRIIRTVIADFGGYEVKTAGDSFIIAVKDVLAGLKIAVAIQLELMRQVPIAEGFEMLDDVQGHGDPEAWNKQTLRVRIGIQHCTEATATYDSIHRRYDYYGTSVNQCARIEAAAAGGQILMSRETFKALNAISAFHDEPCPAFLRDIEGNSELDERGFDHFVAMCDVGKVKLKGIKRPVHLVSVVPISLSGRDFSEAIADFSDVKADFTDAKTDFNI